MRNALFAILVFAASVSNAHAGGFVTLGRSDASFVFVWKDEAAFSHALDAIRTGQHRAALAFAACVVPVGTPAIIVGRAGVGAKFVRLTDGCAGMVTDEDING